VLSTDQACTRLLGDGGGPIWPQVDYDAAGVGIDSQNRARFLGVMALAKLSGFRSVGPFECQFELLKEWLNG